MPLEILSEYEDADGGYNMFRNSTPVLDSKYTTPIRDYNQFGLNRENSDLRNATGEKALQDEMADNGISPPKNIKASWSETIRNVLPSNPLDVNNDGKVDSEDFSMIKESSITKVKAMGSSAISGIGSGLQTTKDTLQAGATKLKADLDTDGDGNVSMSDLGQGGANVIKATAETLKEASGLNDLAKGAERQSSKMIYVGGAVVLLYLLIKA